MRELSVIAFVALAIVIAISLVRLGRYIESINRRIADLEKAEAERKPKAHTHSTIACLEDAMAVIIDAEFTSEELRARLDTARRILGRGRQGPYEYDPDRPAGIGNGHR